MTLWRTMISGGQTINRWQLRRPLLVIVVLLTAFSPSLVSGQTSIVLDADEQLRFAETYFEKGEYYRAIGEYERFIYFFPQDPRVELAMHKVGLSYVKGKRFEQAIDSFNGLIEKYSNTELAIRSYFKVSECYVKLKQFGRALGTLDDLTRIVLDQDIKDEVYYRQGWIYLEMDQLEKAEDSFHSISAKNRDSYQLEKLLENMNKKKFLKTKNPTAAGWLAVVPGAGHLYCERYRDAFIAFLLNGAMILAAYEAFDNDNEALGGLITFFEIGLYSGNIYSAVTSAHKYNRKHKRDFFQYLKEHSTLEALIGKTDGGQTLALSYTITF